jgi:hypothetical protein
MKQNMHCPLLTAAIEYIKYNGGPYIHYAADPAAFNCPLRLILPSSSKERMKATPISAMGIINASRSAAMNTLNTSVAWAGDNLLCNEVAPEFITSSGSTPGTLEATPCIILFEKMFCATATDNAPPYVCVTTR